MLIHIGTTRPFSVTIQPRQSRRRWASATSAKMTAPMVEKGFTFLLPCDYAAVYLLPLAPSIFSFFSFFALTNAPRVV